MVLTRLREEFTLAKFKFDGIERSELYESYVCCFILVIYILKERLGYLNKLHSLSTSSHYNLLKCSFFLRIIRFISHFMTMCV